MKSVILSVTSNPNDNYGTARDVLRELVKRYSIGGATRVTGGRVTACLLGTDPGCGPVVNQTHRQTNSMVMMMVAGVLTCLCFFYLSVNDRINRSMGIKTTEPGFQPYIITSHGCLCPGPATLVAKGYASLAIIVLKKR